LIVIDTSALMAILQGEPEASACRSVVEEQDEILIAAPILAETLIVAAGRQLHGEMARLIGDLVLTVAPLDEAAAYAAVRAYVSWGKGFPRAKFNLCDSFAYALAKERDCPLLFVGDDFALTDVKRALN
jgi:ribonuclease VapC